jgi:hypothetical protein
MAIATTTTLADLMQESMGRCMAAPRIQPLFWPGSPAADALMFWDSTGGGESGHDFNRYGTLTAYDTVEGELFTDVQSLDPTSVNVTPTEKQVITWITNKALKALGAPNAKGARMGDEAAEHVRAHQEKMDTDVFALFTGLTSGLSTTGTNITIAGIEAAKLILRQKKAPGPYWGFLAEQQWGDLMTEASSPLADASKSGTMVGGEIWRNYEVRQFLGVTWFVTDLVYQDGTDAWGAILSNRAIGMVMSELPSVAMVADTSAEAVRRRSTMFSTVASYEATVVDATMGVYLRSDQ